VYARHYDICARQEIPVLKRDHLRSHDDSQMHANCMFMKLALRSMHAFSSHG